MKPQSLTQRVKEIIAGKEGQPFLIEDVKDSLQADGIETKDLTLQGMISRDFVQEGFVKKIGKKGPKGVYRGPRKQKATKAPRREALSTGLTATVQAMIKGKKGAFTVADIAEQLTADKVGFRLKNLQNVISSTLIAKGLVERVGRYKGGQAILYRYAEPAPIEKEPAPIEKEPAPIEKEPAPIEKEPTGRASIATLTEAIRDVIKSYEGDKFVVNDIFDDLEDDGVEFAKGTAGSIISAERKAGRIEQVGKRGPAFVYRQTPGDPPKPPPLKPPTFTAVLIAVAAGLERFSLNYLTTEIEKNGPWTQAEAASKSPSVIQRLKKRDHITATSTRPVVYAMTPRFYIDNLSSLPVYAENAPDLGDRIRQHFGAHCAPAPAPVVQDEPKQAPPLASVDAAPAATTAPSGAVASIARELDRIVQIAAQKTAEIDSKELRYKLEDKAQALLNVTNKLRDLESQNRKLVARIDRLSEIIDEKNRINATLQKRLNDALHGSKRPGGNGGGTFSLAELLHVEGGPVVEAAIDGSTTAPDLPQAEEVSR